MAELELDQIWQALVESAPLTICLLDHERRIRYVNVVEHGFEKSRVLNRQIDDFLPPTDRTRITGIMDEVLRTGAPGSYQTRLQTPSGPVLFLVRLSALRIAGVVRYAILYSLDITEEHHKREVEEREHALLAALEPVNRILLSAPAAEPMFDRVLGEMLTLFDCDRAFLAYPCDPKAAEFSVVYEQTVPEFPGAKGLKLPVDAAVAERFELALAEPGGVVRNDPECNPIPTQRTVMSDFQVRSMMYAAVRSEADKPWLLGIQHCREAHVYDTEVPLLAAIAARVGDGLRIWQAQQATQQSEQRFRLLVEHAPEAILIIDLTTWKFVEVNDRAVELFGMSREHLLQIGPLELSPPTQADGTSTTERMLPLMAAVLAGESPVFEWLHRHASGALLECEVRLLHLPHPEKRLVRGSILNIADRKRAERENERLSNQLSQAQKMQAIGHLTGGVAHDFNNLLTVIGGSLEMMELDTQSDPDLRNYGLLALDACRRAAALTQRLLAFSRQQPLRPRAVNLAQLLSGMEGLLGRTLGETVNLGVVCSTDLWLCEVDPAQLESAILNLSINARDAMLEGGHLTIDACNIVLDVSALPADEDMPPGDYIRLSVTDDGTGIAPELLSKVFEPFFTTKDVGKGSGLGLSMVYGFAKQSRGHVKIYSELGHGTTVRLFLPRSHEAVQAEVVQPTRRIPRGNRELVLVVEDDSNLRALAVELLHHLGYRTLAAGDAASALGLLAETREVALLLADMVLPGGTNGTELARRAHALHPGLPVLFMSGYSENAVIHNGRLDAGVRLLEKPFTTSALALAVRRALDES